MVPLDLAFEELRNNKVFLTVLYILDLIYLIDIIIQFMSAYEDKKYQIQDNLKKIARNYIKYWFFIDLASIIPVKYLYFSGA
jgi:hypothetical protein